MFGNFSQRHSFLIQCCVNHVHGCVFTLLILYLDLFVSTIKHVTTLTSEFAASTLLSQSADFHFSTNSFTTDIFRCNWPDVFYHFVLHFQSGCWRTVYRKMLSLDFFCILLLLHGEETEKCFYFSMCWRCF